MQNRRPSYVGHGYRFAYAGAHFTNDFFHRNSNSMKILFYSHSSCSGMTTIKFCTCATFGSDMIPYDRVTPKPIFHRIWIAMKNRLWNAPPDCSVVSPIHCILRATHDGGNLTDDDFKHTALAVWEDEPTSNKETNGLPLSLSLSLSLSHTHTYTHCLFTGL